jgi:hypothetical protein
LRGTCIEIVSRRSPIVGRVVWVKDGYFGVATQDRVDLSATTGAESPVNDRRAGDRRASDGQASAWTGPDRRVSDRRAAEAARIAHSADRSRAFSSLLQFGFTVAGCAFVAGFAANAAYENLSNTIGAVASGLETP